MLSYAYDNDDNITGITDNVTPANSRTFGYDVRGRLSQTLWQTGSFTREDIIHDANSNRTAVERRINANDNTPAQTDIYTRTTGTNRLASIDGTFGTRSITYDARGNTQSETRSGGIAVTTAYDGHGRLTSLTRTGEEDQTNIYNGMDERVLVSSGIAGGGTTTRRFVYDKGGRVLGEYGTSASNVIAERIWLTPEVADSGMFGGDDGTGGYAPIAIVTGTTLSWVHANHMGVPQLYTDASGAIIATPNYTLPVFPGQFRTFADLYYNKYRDYDVSTGRYIQADPIGLAGGQSPYSYAMGNPLRYTDPSGEFVPIVIAGVCAAGGCEAIAIGLGVLGGLAYNEWSAHNPYNPMGPNTCYFHGNRGGSGGRGGGIFGNPPLTDNEPGDDCDVEYTQEMEYCERKFGVSSSQYGLCKSRAGANLGICKSGGSSLGWWTDEHMDGLKIPQRPSLKRRRW